MPEFGGLEIFVVVCLTLIFLGPSHLPRVVRTLGLWIGRLRRVFRDFTREVEREVGMDEVRQQLHNEQIMAEMKAIEDTTNSIVSDTQSALSINTPENRIENKFANNVSRKDG